MTSVSDDTRLRSNVEFHQVGKPLARTDAPGKATGHTPYAGDYVMPGMLHAKILRSPESSARLIRLDVSKARALKGVVCVLTASELPDRLAATDIPGQTGQPRLKTDQQILVRERVRYHGEPLALIAAETLDIAERAMSMIEYQLEPLPAVFDVEEAVRPGAPVVQGTDNVIARHINKKGDVPSGMASADLVIERTYRTQFIEHAFLEPEVGLAWIDENEVINIRVSTQVIEHFRFIADAVGVPHNKVRILGALVGGGFGGKEDITVEVYLALLARHARQPVRLEFSREDSFMGHGKRHPFVMTYRTGVMHDGKISALDVRMVSDAGAYVYMSPYVLLYAAVAAPGPYLVKNLAVEAISVATNNMYTSAFRGFGAAQACIAYEQQMDEIADALKMDPLDFRRRNYLKTGDPISTGVVLPSAIWTEKCADLAWQALGDKKPSKGSTRIGRGIAAYQQSYGRLTFLHDTSEAWVGVEVDGTVVVRSGVTDIGAGQVSALAQIACEILGVTMENVVVYNSDSAVTPLAGTTTATRGLYMTGNATRLAAEEIRERLVARAAKVFDVTKGQIKIANNLVSVEDKPNKSMTFADLVRICASEGIKRNALAMFRAPFTNKLDPITGQGQAHPDYTFGAHAIELSVDTETGEVTVLQSVACHDVGRCVNPAAVEGQIEGGAAQGQGYALSEEMIYKQGKLLTPSFSEYLIPTAMDMPKVKSIILESHSGLGPFGAKGIGEPALTPVAAAIANAVGNAIGVRIYDLPITPEKIVRALHGVCQRANLAALTAAKDEALGK